MIGSGIFALPSQMAGSAAPGPLLIGWVITGVGMLMLAFVFQTLAQRKPEVDGGVYGYARAGFGNYIGYTSAFGYWASAWMGNVAYLVLLFSTLGYFFPAFEGGTTRPAIIGASILLWIVHFLTLRGVQTAAFVNVIVTIAKIVPILTFIGIAIVGFKAGVFTADFWGHHTEVDGNPLGSTTDQVKNMMLVTVWVFIGIEGAAVYSQRAKKRKDVGRATVVGFLGVLALLLAVNFLSYGLMEQAKLAGLEDPSMAGLMEQQVGSWGAGFISIGLIISLLGALLAWVLLCAEILRIPAQDAVMPTVFGRENAHGSPAAALWLTNGCVQVVLILTLFASSTYPGTGPAGDVADPAAVPVVCGLPVAARGARRNLRRRPGPHQGPGDRRRLPDLRDLAGLRGWPGIPAHRGGGLLRRKHPVRVGPPGEGATGLHQGGVDHLRGRRGRRRVRALRDRHRRHQSLLTPTIGEGAK